MWVKTHNKTRATEAGSPEDPDGDDIDAQLSALNLKKGAAEVWRFWINTGLRIVFAIWSGGIITWWLCFVAGIIKQQQAITEASLVALLSTTTLNILGLSYIVLRGLFNKPPD